MLIACLFPLTGLSQILPSAHPQEDSLAFAKVRERMDSIRQYRPTVGLVLAGGGARGLAHLGVIKLVEELGIPVDVVTGTSMGGLVAGLYALGYKHDELDSLVRAIDWPIMMSDNVPGLYTGYRLKKYREKFLVKIPFHYDDEDLEERLMKEQAITKVAAEQGNTTADMINESIAKMGIGLPDGYLFGLNVRNMLSSISVGYQDENIIFGELPIPYACVATDLYTMTPKYWTSGEITDAMRSTMAIPFYFRAVRQEGEILLDGGMRNNYPVDLARAMGADIVIGSEMSTRRELNDLNSPADFLMQSITLMASSAMGPAMEMLDMNVHHTLAGYNMLSFDEKSVDDIINQGYQNALEEKEHFEAIAQVVAGKDAPGLHHPKPAVNLAQKKVKIGAIQYNGISETDRINIIEKSWYHKSSPKDGMYGRDDVELLLNFLYGTNAFESVSYHLDGKEEPYTLVFDCQKGQVNDFAVGLRGDTDEAVAASLYLGLGTRRLSGSRFAVDLKLGTNPDLSLDWTYKFSSWIPSFGACLRAGMINSTTGPLFNIHEKLFSTAADVYIEDSRLRFGSLRMGVTAEMDPYEQYLAPIDEWIGWDWQSYWLSAFANLKHDTFDDGYFPTKGLRMALNGRYVFNGFSIDLDPERYHIEGEVTTPGGKVPPHLSVLGSIEAALSLSDWFTIIPSAYVGLYTKDDPGYLNHKHVITAGGFIPNRYTERQIPFFGFPTGYWAMNPKTVMGQVDLRFRFLRKNFLTARAGIISSNYEWKDLFTFSTFHAFGLEYGRQSIVGPLKVSAQWCYTVGFTAYASIGFDF